RVPAPRPLGDRATPRPGGQLQHGRDRRTVLALRRPRLDHGLHLHVSAVGRRAMAATATAANGNPAAGHKHPNYINTFWVLLVLTIVELVVVFLPFGK